MDKQAIQKLIREAPNNKIVAHVVPSHLSTQDRKKALQEFNRVTDKAGSGQSVVLIAVPAKLL